MSTPRITAEGFDPESGGFAYLMVDGERAPLALLAAAQDLLAAAQSFIAPYAEVTDAQLRVRAEPGISRTGRGQIHIPIAQEVAAAVLLFRAAVAKATGAV